MIFIPAKLEGLN